MFPLMNSIHGSSVSVLSDGCAQLAEDLALPTHLAQIGIQVIKLFSEIFEYPNIPEFITNHPFVGFWYRIVGQRSNEGNKTATEQHERYWFRRCSSIVQQSIVNPLIQWNIFGNLNIFVLLLLWLDHSSCVRTSQTSTKTCQIVN